MAASLRGLLGGLPGYNRLMAQPGVTTAGSGLPDPDSAPRTTVKGGVNPKARNTWFRVPARLHNQLSPDISRRAELVALLIADTVAVFSVYLAARFELPWFGGSLASLWGTQVPVYHPLFWLATFIVFGLYQERYKSNRFDELVCLGKAITVGILLLFIMSLVWIPDPRSFSHEILGLSWIALFGCVAGSRATVRSVQRALIQRGYSLRKALVVGWSHQVEQLYDDIARYPETGLKIVGAVRLRREGIQSHPQTQANGVHPPAGDGAAVQVEEIVPGAVYTIEALPRLIDELEVQDVLIALGSDDHKSLLEVLRICDGKRVSLKIVPDFYALIGGMARTEHMYGLPLIEVLPEPMPPSDRRLKRMLDLIVSLLVLTIGLPVWILLGVLVRFTSPGPVIYRQQRVGQYGGTFTMYKFRTMRVDAEAQSGPVWARENDPRYTRFGKWLRKTRLDEVPQFWNVLKGEMSVVGPRPERPYFTSRLSLEVPLYDRRHRVKPGITGWAQVKWKYDENLEDVRQKVKYDLFYIGNISLRMDLRILCHTVRMSILGKGR